MHEVGAVGLVVAGRGATRCTSRLLLPARSIVPCPTTALSSGATWGGGEEGLGLEVVPGVRLVDQMQDIGLAGLQGHGVGIELEVPQVDLDGWRGGPLRRSGPSRRRPAAKGTGRSGSSERARASNPPDGLVQLMPRPGGAVQPDQACRAEFAPDPARAAAAAKVRHLTIAMRPLPAWPSPEPASEYFFWAKSAGRSAFFRTLLGPATLGVSFERAKLADQCRPGSGCWGLPCSTMRKRA